MAKSEAEVLLAIFRDWELGRFGTGTELFAPNIRFSAMQPEGQVHATGPAGIRSFMGRFLSQWALYRIELHELEELSGGGFIAKVTQHGTGKGSGADTTMPAFIAIAFRDDKIAQMEFLPDRENALIALEHVTQ